jgi:ATP-binding cassette, subfamily B, bacterial
MRSFQLKSVPTKDPTSGITGAPEIEEPATTGRAPVDLPARLRRAGKLLTAAGVSLPRVVGLVWRASPWLTVGLAFGTIVTALTPVATALIARLLINSVSHAIAVHSGKLPDLGVVGPVAGFALHTTATGAIVGTVVLQLLLLLCNALASSLRNVTSALLQQRVSQDIQVRVMDHASRLELAFFEDATSYDLIRQAQLEASARPVTMIEGLCGLAQGMITFAGAVALLVALNPLVAVAALVAPVPAFLVDARFGKMGFAVSMWSSPIRRRMQYFSTLVTTDTYAKEVKLFGLGPYFSARFRVLAEVFYRRYRRQVTRRNLASTFLGTLTNLVTALTYLYVALLAVTGRLSLGDLVLYTVAATTLQAAAQTMFGEITGMYENNLYLNTLYRMLATEPAITRPRHPVSLPDPLRGHIVVDNVTFRYPGADRPALRDVSFEIPPGRTVAIVGRNGAGKSTLVKLVCRLYDPTAGRILLDGVDLRDLDPDELHARISATFQDYVTYQATAAENIGLGDCRRIEDRAGIEAAAVEGGAHDLISRMPNGYDTPLGKWFEGGVNLSGGEWQKIALSRAFVRDSRILVFDEPTSALDPTSEHELFSRLRNLAEGRSTIYVSHRFSTVRQADRILLLSNGRATEQGTHRELLHLDGEYARLFRTQASAYVDLPEPLHQPLH